MASPETVACAKNFAVMVRVQGPDPKGLKMRNHAFHQYNSGRTTLSASGFLLPETLYDTEVAKHLCNRKDEFPTLIMTQSSIFEPFMPLQLRDIIPEGRPELIPGVQIDVMVEDDLWLERDVEVCNRGAHQWHTAHLLSSFDIPASATALQSIVGTSIDTKPHGWEVGWSLASHANGPQPIRDALQRQIENNKKTFVGSQRQLDFEGSNTKFTIRIAILGVFSLPKDVPSFSISPSRQRGAFLLAVGSPFGILSPVHFFNSISVGSISNCYPPSSYSKSLLMADIKCLPGMEGSPVFDEHARLIGILSRPLRHNISGAEIQLLIPWEGIATACSDLLLGGHDENDSGKTSSLKNETTIWNKKVDRSFSYMEEHSSVCPFPLEVEKAMASICLVTIDEGIWASGVLLNSQGLILTNAHLIEPWRYGKTNLSRGSSIENAHLLQSLTPMHNGFFAHKTSGNSPPNTSTFADKFYRNLRVRLDNTEPWIWYDAKVVYICKGPLDVALLQLEQIPELLSPITMDLSWPSPGSKTYVLGHGLLGPKCGFSPSVCSGVVAKVVKAKISTSSHETERKRGIDPFEYFPAMLETTSAVHPGGSGGAVLNSKGHMIGLVTSNARHGGGTIIPHLNFSIPCAALEPICRFSKDLRDLSVLQILDKPDEQLSSVWALTSPPPPKSTQLVDEDDTDTKKSKGSKFAKFIAETERRISSKL